jgi:hypothetical protein
LESWQPDDPNIQDQPNEGLHFFHDDILPVPEPRSRFEGTAISQKLGVDVRLFYHQLEDL